MKRMFWFATALLFFMSSISFGQEIKLRLEAIKKLTDQTLLADIAKNDANWEIRLAAVENLTDQTILAEIAKKDVKWFVRKAAVNKLNNLDILTDIASHDEVSIVRNSAMSRLNALQPHKEMPVIKTKTEAADAQDFLPFLGSVQSFGSATIRTVISGRINLYEAILYKYTPPSHPTRLGGYTSSYTEDCFSKDGGLIQKVNYRNLKRALSDNPDAMKYLQDYRKLRNLEIILASTGVGMLFTGVILSMDKGQAETIILVGGAITTNLAWIPHFTKQGKIKKAIIAYNKYK